MGLTVFFKQTVLNAHPVPSNESKVQPLGESLHFCPPILDDQISGV
jgi:hypothetical protein